MSDETQDNSTDFTAEVAAASDGVSTFFVADFSDTATAWEACEALRDRGRPPRLHRRCGRRQARG